MATGPFLTLQSLKTCVDQNKLHIEIGDLGGRSFIYGQDGYYISFKFKKLLKYLMRLSQKAYLECHQKEEKILVKRNTYQIALALLNLHERGEITLEEAGRLKKVLTIICRLFGNFNRLPHAVELDRILLNLAQLSSMDPMLMTLPISRSTRTLEIQKKPAVQGLLYPLQMIATGNNPTCVAFAPSGILAAVTNAGDSTVTVYRINPQNGQFTQIQTIASGPNPMSIVFSPLGNIAVATSWGNSTLTVYSINQITGLFTQIQSIPTGKWPSSISFSGSGKLAAVANKGETGTHNVITVYQVNSATGMFSQIQKVTAPLGYGPCQGFAFAPSKFAAAIFGIFVVVYGINLTNGNLTTLQTIQAKEVFSDISISSSGDLSTILSFLTNKMKIYSINGTSGNFTQLQTVDVGSGNNGPIAVAFAPSTQTAAVTIMDGSISVYSINPSTGKFTQVQSEIVASNVTLSSIAFSPRGTPNYSSLAAITVNGPFEPPNVLKIYGLH